MARFKELKRIKKGETEFKAVKNSPNTPNNPV